MPQSFLIWDQYYIDKCSVVVGYNKVSFPLRYWSVVIAQFFPFGYFSTISSILKLA